MASLPDGNEGTFTGPNSLITTSPASTSWVNIAGWNGCLFVWLSIAITAGTVTLEEADDSSGTNSQTVTDEEGNDAVVTITSRIRGAFAIDTKALSKQWIRLAFTFTGVGVACAPIMLDAAQVEAGFGDSWDVRIRTKESDL